MDRVCKSGNGMEGESRDLQSMMQEIMSLDRERKDLLDSLTPSCSGWKLTDGGRSSTSWRIAGEDAASVLDSNRTESPSNSHQLEKELANHFDSMLQDMEDLGHRMLSMTHVLHKSDDASTTDAPTISYYKACELFISIARLRRTSQEFYEDIKDPEEVEEEKIKMLLSKEFFHLCILSEGEERFCQDDKYWEEVEKLMRGEDEDEDEGEIEGEGEEVPNQFLSLYNTYLESYSDYENKLVLMVEDGDDDDDDYHDVDVDVDGDADEDEGDDRSTMDYFKKGVDVEQANFADEGACWERVWGSKIGKCGGFEDITTLSPMHFTHCTPGAIPSLAAVAASTLQIYSIRILELQDNLSWPLKVYGVVAARDTVDHNRNILFSRSRLNYQNLKKEDSSLCLTGPSRAIVADDPVDFELELKINEGAESRDRTLISCSFHFDRTSTLNLFGSVKGGPKAGSLVFPGDLCSVELNFQQLNTSLQAIIVGVRVVKGDWPFSSGCRISCSWSTATKPIGTYGNVVLLDYCGKNMRVGLDDYLLLSRNVVSVELQGTMRVIIQAYMESGCNPLEGYVDFPIQHCQTSNRSCLVGNSTIEVIVAWSFLVKEKMDLLVEGYAAQA